jgi:hypothetical protein
MKQSTHTNHCRTLHKFFIYTIWILDLLRYILPKLFLCGLMHEPSILNGDRDIVSNLKSASAFEYFPCFTWFNWKAIQIKCCHVSYSRRYLIVTSSTPSPVFALGRHPEIATHMAQIFQARWGVRGHLFFTIKNLKIE